MGAMFYVLLEVPYLFVGLSFLCCAVVCVLWGFIYSSMVSFVLLMGFWVYGLCFDCTLWCFGIWFVIVYIGSWIQVVIAGFCVNSFDCGC